MTPDSPTLFRNDINRHVSLMATTEVATVNSPWLASFTKGERHSIAFSHGEGKFVVSPELAKELFAKGQVAFRYVDNPNGSHYDIEGIVSPDGHILGKMGHTMRTICSRTSPATAGSLSSKTQSLTSENNDK